MRKLENAPNAPAPNADYPKSRIKDDTGSGDGVPVNEYVYGDIVQFFLKLVEAASIVENELPDNDSNGYQLVDALDARILDRVKPASVWLNLTGTGYNIDYRITKTNDVQMKIEFTSSFSSGVVIDTLPLGFRPTKKLTMPIGPEYNVIIDVDGTITSGIYGATTGAGIYAYLQFPND